MSQRVNTHTLADLDLLLQSDTAATQSSHMILQVKINIWGLFKKKREFEKNGTQRPFPARPIP